MVDRPMTRIVIVATAVGLSLPATTGHAQSAPPAVTRDDVQALTASVGELAELLRSSLDDQERYRRLELAIAYLQFRSRRIEGLERELRNIDDSKASLGDGIERRRQQLTELEATVGNSSGEDADRMARMTDQLRAMIESQQSQLDRLERTAIDLENDIADGRRQLQRFEEYVLENLDLED